ncbi:MAG: phosphoribosylglycinamide formyltransferase [Nitrososphaerales archaeon]
MTNVAIFFSGAGTNLQALITAFQSGKFEGAQLKLALTNRKDAGGLEVARQAGIDSVILDAEGKRGKDWNYDQKILEALEAHDVLPSNGLILLAGFMRLISDEFVRIFRWKILNIHPSLLPKFPGSNAVEQALSEGAKITGCTVHFVDEGIDEGPVIMQASVPVKEDDTPDTLLSRIHKEEHQIYVSALELVLQGKVRLDGRKVKILK